MLQFETGEFEFYDDENELFVLVPSGRFRLEHSLVSISKWESKWKASFLDTPDKTDEQIIDYISMMCLDPVDPVVVENLSNEHLKAIADYISDPQTATVFSKKDKERNSASFTTSELIYYWMTALQIPFECQYWHLNRLITLIRIASIKNNPDKAPRVSRSELLANNRALNEAAKAKYNTEG